MNEYTDGGEKKWKDSWGTRSGCVIILLKGNTQRRFEGRFAVLHLNSGVLFDFKEPEDGIKRMDDAYKNRMEKEQCKLDMS